MKRLFLGLMVISFLYPAKLDVFKIYPIKKELCVYRGCGYWGSNTLDISNMNLDSLVGISDLYVDFEDTYIQITKVPRLRILAHNNNISTLPHELDKLSLIALDVNNNNDIRIPKWIFREGKFYVYYGDSLHNGYKKRFIL